MEQANQTTTWPIFVSTISGTMLPNSSNVTSTLDPYNVSSIYDKCSDTVLYLVIVCYALFWIIGFPANVITIVALVKGRRTRNTTTLFIINLCAVDAILCFFVPPFAIPTVLYRRWTMNSASCQIFALVRYAYNSVSLWTIAAIAINRYIMIVHSGQYQNLYTKKSTIAMIFIIWFSAVASLMPTLLGQWGRFGYQTNTGTCTILPDKNGKSPKLFLLAAFILVPTVTLLVCYPLIYWKVWRSTKAMEKHRTTTWHDNTGTLTKVKVLPVVIGTPRSRIDSAGSDVSSMSLSGTGHTKTSKEMRVLKLALVVFCTFVLCYFPVILVQLFNGESNHPSLMTLGYVTVYFSACINPVIYVIISKEYRSDYKNLLTNSCRRWKQQDSFKNRASNDTSTTK